MQTMALLNYTTKVDAERSIAEIQRMLVKHGVHAMRTDYDGPHVKAVSFAITMQGKEVGFQLPCNWRAVLEVFNHDKERLGRRWRIPAHDMEGQAIRTAWRIIKDWVEAQLALVEVNMVTVPQVFLPYAVGSDGRTLGEAMLDDPGRLLGSGN